MKIFKNILRKSSLFLILSTVLLLFISIGDVNAMWILLNLNGKASTSGEVASLSGGYSPDAICYRKEITGDLSSTNISVNSTIYYTELSDCLRDATGNGIIDDIYIIPSTGINYEESATWQKTQVFLSKDETGSTYTIEENDTLILPYEGEKWGARYSYETGYRWDEATFPGKTFTGWNDSTGTSDFTLPRQLENLKTELVLDTGITLSVKGRLFVGGIFGNGNLGTDLAGLTATGQSQYQGFVSGSYAQISMKSGSQIIVEENNLSSLYSTLCIEGYIKEYDKNNPSNGIVVNSGGYLHMPLAISDWQGGMNMVKIYTSGAFPFNIYEFPSLQVKTTFNYGSHGYALTVLSGNAAEFEMISSRTDIDVLFDIRSANSSITFEFTNNASTTVTTNGESRSISVTRFTPAIYWDITFRGDIAIEKIGIAVSGLEETYGISEVSTTQRGLPFSYKSSIKLEDSFNTATPTKLTIPDGSWVKLLPGSSLVIGENCTLKIEEGTTYGGGKVIAYKQANYDNATNYPIGYPAGHYDVYIINNGTIEVGGAIGGSIDTELTNGAASVEFANTNSSHFSASIKEINYQYGQFASVTMSENAVGDIDDDESGTLDGDESDFLFLDSGATSFVSHSSSTYWTINAITIEVGFANAPNSYAMMQIGGYGFYFGETVCRATNSRIRFNKNTTEVVLNNWYGVESFEVAYSDGSSATVDPSSTINVQSVTKVTALLGSTYTISLSINASVNSADYTQTTVSTSVHAVDGTLINTPLSISASESNQYPSRQTFYIGTGGKFKVTTTGGGWVNGVTVTSATPDGDYYIPTGNSSIYGGVYY